MESAFLAAAVRLTTKARRAGGAGGGGPSLGLTAQIGGTKCMTWGGDQAALGRTPFPVEQRPGAPPVGKPNVRSPSPLCPHPPNSPPR